MISNIIINRIIGVIVIALGCLFLTRKKIIINQQWEMIFVSTLFFGQMAINTNWPYQYLLLTAVLYLFSIIILCIMMKGRYSISNIKIETLMTAITNLLDEKGIVYEVKYNSVALTNYDNKEIKCEGQLNSAEINFRGIIRLPFYDDVKDKLISKVKLIKETVFPATGVFCITAGIIFIGTIQLMVNA